MSTPLESNSLTAVASLVMVLKVTVVTYGTPLFLTHDGPKLCRLFAVRDDVAEIAAGALDDVQARNRRAACTLAACMCLEPLLVEDAGVRARQVGQQRTVRRGRDRARTVELLITLVACTPFEQASPSRGT